MPSIDDLPEIVLEFIMTLVDPYKDLASCSRVCRSWNSIAKRARLRTRRGFLVAIEDGRNLKWCHHTPPDHPLTHIQKRHSHSCAILNSKMYIFGGCTAKSATTYNDIWEFDLSERHWRKPVTSGTYPPPKATASMVAYNDNLVVFGGWSDSASSIFTPWRFFDQIHVFNPESKLWVEVKKAKTGCQESCPRSAAHSASVFREHYMLLFGGLQTEMHHEYSVFESNDVWLLDLRDMNWTKQRIDGEKPRARFNHTQITIDDRHIFILGGCVRKYETQMDMWLLEAEEPTELDAPGYFNWKWIPVDEKNPEDAVPKLRLHPACRVGDKLVILGRSRYPKSPSNQVPGSPVAAKNNSWQSTMCFYSLDISRLVSHHEVTWSKTRKVLANQPKKLVRYTLVKGEGELLMFGGVDQTVLAANPSNVAEGEHASNCLYTLSLTPEVI